MIGKLLPMCAFGVLVVSGCGGGLDAKSACAKLESAGVAKNCKETKLDGLAYLLPKSGVAFDAPGATEGASKVLDYKDRDTLLQSFEALDRLSRLSGETEIKNEKRLIVVEVAKDASESKVEDIKKAVEGL